MTYNAFSCLQMEDSEGTVRQIGAFSEGINNLTVRSQATHSHSDQCYSTILESGSIKLSFIY